MYGLLANDGVLDVFDDLFPRYRLDVVRIDVADQPILEIALARVTLGMCQQLAGVGVDADFLRRQQPRDRSRRHIHGGAPLQRFPSK
jgi:hypothetical protein